RSQCVAIVYVQPSCTLLGAENRSMACTRPGKVEEIRLTDCPNFTDRNLAADLGNDPCVTGFFNDKVRFDAAGICPRDANKFVVRGVDEFGTRVTLDNDSMNSLTYNATRRMWKFYRYGSPDSGFIKWLVAVSCATAGKT
ncbi:hypothetical protein PENTCL1PPCAC_8026, partial [Pristionchus entomophagus]